MENSQRNFFCSLIIELSDNGGQSLVAIEVVVNQAANPVVGRQVSLVGSRLGNLQASQVANRLVSPVVNQAVSHQVNLVETLRASQAASQVANHHVNHWVCRRVNRW
jgi:hypothetical protein